MLLLLSEDSPRRFRAASFDRRFRKGGGSSQSQSSTSNQTVNDSKQTDNRIATSGTSIVAAGGSSVGEVTIESQDAATTQAAISAAASTSEAALESNRKTSAEALKSAVDLGKYSFDASRDLGTAALDISKGISGQAFDFAKASQETAAKNNRDTLAFTDSAISKASAAFGAAKSGDTAQLQDTLKQIAIGALLVGGVVGTAYLLKRK